MTVQVTVNPVWFRLAAAGAALCGAAVIVAYVSITTAQEGDNATGQVTAWSILFGLPTLAAAIGAVAPSVFARWLLVGVVAAFAVLGFVAGFSVGGGLLLGAVFALLAALLANVDVARVRGAG